MLDPGYFLKIAELLRNAVNLIESEVGINIRYFDMGGGFGIPYKPGEKPLDLNALISLKEFLSWRTLDRTR